MGSIRFTLPEEPPRLYWGTALLLSVVLLTFLLELTLAYSAEDFKLLLGTHAGIGNDALLFRLGALPGNGDLQGQYWRLLTAGFLHRNLMHIVSNASYLLLMGIMVERRLGFTRLLLVFLSTSVLGSFACLLSSQIEPGLSVSVGASAGTYGLLGAALILVYRVPPARPAIRLIPWLLLTIGIAVSFMPNISMAAHAAGLGVGVLAGMFARISH